jgi:hypothetical protein
MFGVPNQWRKNSDGSLTHYVETAEFTEAVAYSRKLWQAGVFHPDTPSMQQSQAQALIGNGTVALLGDPDSWDRLRQDPALVPAAIEEMLRYDSPVQLTSRIATEDVEVGGSVIAAGRPVIVSIGGANRDPGVFEQPDEFRIDRPDTGRHLSFSLGLHHCLGASLARLEGRIAIEELTRRYPALELAAPPTRRSLLVLRGFESVPVRASQMRTQSAA